MTSKVSLAMNLFFLKLKGQCLLTERSPSGARFKRSSSYSSLSKSEVNSNSSSSDESRLSGSDGISLEFQPVEMLILTCLPGCYEQSRGYHLITGFGVFRIKHPHFWFSLCLEITENSAVEQLINSYACFGNSEKRGPNAFRLGLEAVRFVCPILP
jgi:hypothetical protein